MKIVRKQNENTAVICSNLSKSSNVQMFNDVREMFKDVQNNFCIDQPFSLVFNNVHECSLTFINVQQCSLMFIDVH